MRQYIYDSKLCLWCVKKSKFISYNYKTFYKKRMKKQFNTSIKKLIQSRFDARYWMLGAGALGQPRGMVWGGRREEGSGWGTHEYLWQIHFDIWQNQYNIVKLKKIKFKKIKNKIKYLKKYKIPN